MPAELASGNFKSEEHLSTAFGLAALMHNGFPPPTINFPVSSANNSKQTTQAGGEERQWSQQQNHHQQNQQQEEGTITWNNNKASNTYTQKLFKVKTKQEPVAQEITAANGTNIKSEHTQVHKRYNCLVCPYSTDRRDLFTRHENIHKEEKPFHCYACLKQFNRADHVKKHFLRMHREMEYDINKTRRYPPSSKQVNSIASNNNSSNKNNNNNYFYNQPQQQQTTTEPQQLLVGTTINIPTFSQNQSNNNNNANGGSQQHNTATIIEHVVHNSGSTSSAPTINVNSHQMTTVNIKHEKMVHSKSPKSKSEKRFMCCYCPWSGADNWGLKRHLNTHTKPFVCLLCDYKAARSERLTTHIFKVHNKKACNKCNFFADDAAQLAQHQLDAQ
jgi:KRAB domain-containing zinc finger protein